MSLDALAKNINFESIQSKGLIKYDPEKLRWLNHKWISQLEQNDLALRARPFIEKSFPEAEKLTNSALELLISTIASDLTTLSDAPKALRFYFVTPEPTQSDFTQHMSTEEYKTIASILKKEITNFSNSKFWMI